MAKLQNAEEILSKVSTMHLSKLHQHFRRQTDLRQQRPERNVVMLGGVAKGAVGATAPVGLDSDKIFLGSVVHGDELIWKWRFFSFYEKRSVA